MAIEGINTRMTSLQFSRALAATTRRVETSAATGSSPGEGQSAFGERPGSDTGARGRDTQLALPSRLHWGYRTTVINGRAVAQRAPQLAAGDSWGAMVERVG